MLISKTKVKERDEKITLNEDDESLVQKILNLGLYSRDIHEALAFYQIKLLNYIISSSRCNSFEGLVKKLYYTKDSGIKIRDRYYKELLFRTATKQHLEIMDVERTFFKFITNLSISAETLFKNFEELFLLKKEDELSKIIQDVKNDKSFLQSVKELDKKFFYIDFTKRAKVYNYLKSEFYSQINSSATEAVALLFTEYPLMPILINVYKYAEGISTNAFTVDLPDFYQRFLGYYTTKGDFIDTVTYLNSSTVVPKQLKNTLCMLTGTRYFKDVIRKYFILKYQSEYKDNELLDIYNHYCVFLYFDIMKYKQLSYYDEKNLPSIVEGYVRYSYWDLIKQEKDTESFLKKMKKKHNLSDKFITSIPEMYKLSKNEKFKIIADYTKSMNFFMSK